MSMIMGATLHDRAPNTYYGQWLSKSARKHAAKMGTIARNEFAVSTGVATLDVLGARFLGESLAGASEISVSAKKKYARQAKCALTRNWHRPHHECHPERNEGSMGLNIDPSLRSG